MAQEELKGSSSHQGSSHGFNPRLNQSDLRSSFVEELSLVMIHEEEGEGQRAEEKCELLNK